MHSQLPISISSQFCMKRYGANSVQITLLILSRQFIDTGFAIGIHPGYVRYILSSSIRRKRNEWCSITLVVHLIVCDIKGFYLSWKMWHYRHPTSMAQTLFVRAIPKGGIK